MPDWSNRKSAARRGARLHSAALEATPTREQATRKRAKPETRTLTGKKHKRPTITLQDGTVVDAYLATNEWNRLRAFMRREWEELERTDKFVPPKRHELLQSLLAIADSRFADANPQHFDALSAPGFISDDGRSIDPLTRAVLLNSTATADGLPMIGTLRLKTAADKVVAQKMAAQLHQQETESHARAFSPGGEVDQMWELLQRTRGKGRSKE